jgi:hypothetical protein
MNNDLLIDKLILIDENGMPKAPTIRQLIDSDVKELYRRDKSTNKDKYLKECIVIYYLGDPKSPAKQSGLSDAESLKMAIEQAGLPADYIPDALVLRLIKRYYSQCITEAGRVVENIIETIHNVNLSISAINDLLNEKLINKLSIDDIASVVTLIDAVTKKANEIPSTLKHLEEAKQNLLYEKETELSRGGSIVTSSMDAENY